MRSKFKWIFALLLAFSMQFSFAQEKTITGVVTESGMPLPGVTVAVKGTTRGTQTDFDGKYSIKASTGEVIEFSYIGMKTQTSTVGASSTISVVMTVDDATSLNEVVVVAYGTQKREAITGAIGTIGADVIGNQQVTSPLKALQGTVAGVSMITAGGQPGNNPEIRIRGFGSLTAGAGPLIVVDGAPFNGNINTISQDQIETLSVLKDGASASLYGSRGANGVILITTKRGKKNSAPRINVRSQVGISDLAVGLHDRIGTEQNMKLTWEAIRNTNMDLGQNSTTAASNASGQLIDRLGYNPYGTVVNPIDASGQLVPGAQLLWETDWQKEMTRQTMMRTNHSFDISGGDDKTTYFMSVDYLKEDGPVITSDFERITTRLNVDSQVSDWLKVGLNSSFSYSNSSNPDQTTGSTTQAIGWIYALSSIYPLHQRDGNGELFLDANGNRQYDFGNGSIPGQSVNNTRPVNGGENAVANIYLGKERLRRTSYVGSVFAEAKIFESLKFRTRFSYENFLFDSFSFDDDLFGAASSVGGRVTQARNITTTLNAINGLHFNKTFGNHNLAADAIIEAYSLNLDNMNAQGIGFLPGLANLGTATSPEAVGGVMATERINSYLARINYNYKDKYFVEGSARRDGSTRFDRDVRWGTFYSAGGGWIISKESFLENNETLSYLKLRGSYGELGNADLGTVLFPYQSLFSAAIGGNEGNPGVLLDGVADINLKWEKTAQISAGLDFGLFNDRITGSIDYYKKNSIDLILDKPLAPSLGVSTITTNIGEVENSGFELMLNSTNIQTEDFTWKTSINISKNSNEIIKLATEDPVIRGIQQWEVGKSLYEFFIPEWAGVDPADGAAMWFRDVEDAEGNVIGRETTKLYDQATRGYHGSSLPDFEGGFTSNMRYKNFDLNLIFNFSVGGQILDTDYSSLMNGFSSPGGNAHPDNLDRWQNPGDITNVPRLVIGNNNDAATSTRFLFDNDYLRLKSLTLGYNLPSDMVKSIGFSNVRFFVQADNVVTFQSHKGIDPEQSFAGTTARRSPQFRTVSTGVTLSF
ncbi:SusC/RagA family TonB-linked outer membrane protein [Flavobacterium soli]|uniref:SusC/RagA family TonB-linked outer membrane protein n=1 Tax=Flavobacterium soli TaxID=344881 RepID=UPI00047D022F|nr:TonB-dependent receptor [Flavobacterium soli]